MCRSSCLRAVLPTLNVLALRKRPTNREAGPFFSRANDLFVEEKSEHTSRAGCAGPRRSRYVSGGQGQLDVLGNVVNIAEQFGSDLLAVAVNVRNSSAELIGTNTRIRPKVMADFLTAGVVTASRDATNAGQSHHRSWAEPLHCITRRARRRPTTLPSGRMLGSFSTGVKALVTRRTLGANAIRDADLTAGGLGNGLGQIGKPSALLSAIMAGKKSARRPSRCVSGTGGFAVHQGQSFSIASTPHRVGSQGRQRMVHHFLEFKNDATLKEMTVETCQAK